MQLKGKTALITGSCGEGMGRSTAFRLAREGANIVLNYGTHRRGEKMAADAAGIADAVAQLGGKAIVQQADTRDERQVAAMVSAAVEAFGQVDILVNNAGGDWEIRDYTQIPLGDWKAVLAAEIDGPFLLMKHVAGGMRQRRWGRIIHIGMAGVLWMQGMKGLAPDYCLGKAVRAWMATAFGPGELARGVTVNCVEPGHVPHMSFEGALAAARSQLSAWEPQEGATCADVAQLVAFLCSEAGRFVTGNTIRLGRLP